MNRFLLLGIWILVVCSCAAQQQTSNIADAVNRFATDSCFKGATVGVVVADVATGKLLAVHNPHTALTPASCQKLITTATALELLGSDYQFKTTISINGSLQNGVIKGNLTIKGFGDPALESKYFKTDKSFAARLTDILKLQHITKIEGRIIANSNYFSAAIPRTWIWEDIGNYYGAVPHAINYRDNLYTLFFQSGKTGRLTKITNVVPQNTGLNFENYVKSSVINKDLAYVFGGNTSSKRRIEGTIPQNRTDFKVKGALLHPEICLINDLRQELKKYHIAVEGKRIAVKNKKILHTFYSPKLADIVKQTNQKSINLFADNLLFAIAKKQSGEAAWDMGCKAVLNYWASKGIDTKYVKLLDGSGLSRFNAVPADFLNKILCRMSANSDFINSLPIAGKSGTLKYFGRNSSFTSDFKAKTGSMSGVQTYAGYLKTRSDKIFAVTILINNYFCKSKKVKQKVEALIEELWR